MVHGMSHKWYLSHFVAQKVTIMTQLKSYILNGFNESATCTTEVKKLSFI